MSEIASIDDLLAVQRKEKKELVAKTQKMKHAVPKGDKKKKKEVTAEIAQLLADLDLKHDNELKVFEKNGCSAEKSGPLENIPKEEDDGCSTEKSELLDNNKEEADMNSELSVNIKAANSMDKGDKIPRLSKAQKRRNKKAMMEKERSKAIAEQELENLSGLRHLESEEIQKKLSQRNLTVYEVPSDGNCLYKAVEHQLSSLKLKQTTVQSLREMTSEYMLSHMQDYIPFLTCPESGDVLTEEQYVKYCEDIAKTSAWGGHTEIQALSQICGTQIEIIQAQGPSIISGEDNGNPKLILSYHRHTYGLGEHYNSVVPMS